VFLKCNEKSLCSRQAARIFVSCEKIDMKAHQVGENDIVHVHNVLLHFKLEQ